MTTTNVHTTSHTLTTPTDLRRTSAIAGFVSYVVGAAFIVPNAHGIGEIVTVLIIAAVVTVAVFGWLLPRGMDKGAPRTALALSALAALLILPAFWSMLPLLLGVAGVILGRACVEHAPKRAYAAIVLGVIGVAGFLFLYVVLGLIMGDL